MEDKREDIQKEEISEDSVIEYSKEELINHIQILQDKNNELMRFIQEKQGEQFTLRVGLLMEVVQYGEFFKDKEFVDMAERDIKEILYPHKYKKKEKE